MIEVAGVIEVKNLNFECPVCGEKFKKLEDYLNHMYEEHNWGPNNPNPST